MSLCQVRQHIVQQFFLLKLRFHFHLSCWDQHFSRGWYGMTHFDTNGLVQDVLAQTSSNFASKCRRGEMLKRLTSKSRWLLRT